MTTILLFSGGLDSTAAFWMLTHPYGLPDILPVYIPLGSRYTDKEVGMLRHHPVQPKIASVKPNLGELEQEDGFIPQRNALLCTIAQAVYDADVVFLCSVAGEYSRDKHEQFFFRISNLLSYTANKQVSVRSPFPQLTKTQLVREYLSKGGPLSWLKVSVSCYDAKKRSCGACMSCFRRWIALANNGIANIDSYASPPWWFGLKAAIRNRHLPATVPPDEREAFKRAQRDAISAYARLLTGRG